MMWFICIRYVARVVPHWLINAHALCVTNTQTDIHTCTDRHTTTWLPCKHKKQPVDNVPHNLQRWFTNK